MSKDTSGPAFPDLLMNRDGEYSFSGGMTLRQWYAGMAMQGLLSNERWPEVYVAAGGLNGREGTAAKAFEFADAMLAREAKEAAE